MSRAVKLLLLGGAVGAAVVATKPLWSPNEGESDADSPTDDAPPVSSSGQAARSVGVGAGVGAAAGWLTAVALSMLSRLRKRATSRLPKFCRGKKVDLSDLERASRKARKAAKKATYRARETAGQLSDARREKLAS